MRKKYLSALLFGALLFASAGTFTSCKDYDDDISNLQEQINTVVADLNDLKALVGDGGVSSVTFDEATGVLTVVDAAGTHTYTIKTSAGEVGEIKVTIDDERNLVVNDEIIGQVGDVVTVNEEGYLCVNGEATEIKAGKYAILENESDNTYTITLPDAEGNMQTITLLKSIATDITISTYYYTSYEDAGGAWWYSQYALFTEINPTISKTNANGTNEFKYSKEFETENGIAWGVASSDVDWKGPKGAVKAGQLLIGQQNNVIVQVSPRNVQLDQQSLKLVDRDGNVAPVTVTPTAYNYGANSSGSRAVSNEGQWALDITMDNTITANNIGTAFATQDHTINQGNHDGWSNRLYALQVNGNVLTNYAFVIDTDENACGMTNKDELKAGNGIIKVDNYLELKSGTPLEISLGSHELSFEQASVYDYMFEIVEADKNDAEAWGITLENNILTAANTTTAAGQTIHLNVKLLGVDGEVVDFGYKSATSTPLAIKFGTATTGAITLPVSTYKVTPEEYANSQDPTTGDKRKYATMVLDMGDLFSGLTAQEAIVIKDQKGKINLTTKDETFPFLRATIVGTWNEVGSSIKFYKADKETEVDFADDQSNIREIKYAKVFYNETGITDGLWNPKATLGEHTLQMILTDAAGNQIRKANIPVNVTVPTFFELFTKSGAWVDNVATAVVDETGHVDLKQLYNDKTNVKDAFFDSEESAFIADNNSAGALADPETSNTVTLNKEAVKDHALKDLTTELVYKIVPECEAFWVTSGDFTMDVVTKLDAAKFIYYGTDGKETNIIVQPETENKIKAYQVTNGVKTGLSFYKAGTDNVFTSGVVVNGFTLDVANDILLPMEFDDNAGDKATAKFEHGVLTVSGLAKGNYTTVLTVTYKAASEFGGTSVYETFQIPLTVQGVEE